MYSDSIGDKDSPAPTYLDMLRYNTTTIVEALSREVTVGEPQEESEANNFILFGILAAILIGGFLLVFRRLNQA